jgi:hypothetical protein
MDTVAVEVGHHGKVSKHGAKKRKGYLGDAQAHHRDRRADTCARGCSSLLELEKNIARDAEGNDDSQVMGEVLTRFLAPRERGRQGASIGGGGAARGGLQLWDDGEAVATVCGGVCRERK